MQRRSTFIARQLENMTVIVILAAFVFVTLLILSCAKNENAPIAAPPPRYLQTGYAVKLKKMEKDVATTTAQTDTAFNTEEYGRIDVNPFLAAAENPLSTFSIDVDRASYSNVRRMLGAGQRPPRDAVRIEEMVNYFTYDYPQPRGSEPFSVTTEMATCPWNEKNRLLLIGLQGKRIDTRDLPPSNLVFLVDVSGSMMEEDKLPLLQQSLALLVDQMRPQDRVALVAYAGNAGLVLPSTSGSSKGAIREAIAQLEAGGSTAGGAGIELAYNVAKENFIADGNNRVILATDGDFNVGVSSDGELEKLIEQKRGDGIFLTVLGFGTGDVKDSKMELLADKGNGNYAYIDTIGEARKVLVHEMGATLFTIAKDVKLQIEFNPAHVLAYRLIGYENRLLRKEDFHDDKKDAGDMGAGHSVTAMYEIVPPDGDVSLAKVDALKYQKVTSSANDSPDLLTLKIRYKAPASDTSELITQPLLDSHADFAAASNNLRFAASVAELGMLLRDSKYKGNSSFADVERIASSAEGKDAEGYRHDFVSLVSVAKRVMAANEVAER